MRIISQDGCYDVPYEQVMLQRYEKDIYLMSRNFSGVEEVVSDPIIAKYSSKEKAIKAMEMCRTAYADCMFNNNIVPGITSMLSTLHPIQRESVADEFARINIFQFPKDEEVKV